ncbi:hypothetical protein L6452_00503 [Arctium lappa]|uniref:Uncharacterized protein n=1 Tax=Arctium lappa TaxID=4217 RepID=A0ACB9FEH8_ARCLA|nr:hypothetical protein L6452_00503 [Arctium lappa]
MGIAVSFDHRNWCGYKRGYLINGKRRSDRVKSLGFSSMDRMDPTSMTPTSEPSLELHLTLQKVRERKLPSCRVDRRRISV